MAGVKDKDLNGYNKNELMYDNMWYRRMLSDSLIYIPSAKEYDQHTKTSLYEENNKLIKDVNEDIIFNDLMKKIFAPEEFNDIESELKRFINSARNKRLVYKISPKDIADMCGVSRQTINNMESGKYDAPAILLFKYVNAIEVLKKRGEESDEET